MTSRGPAASMSGTSKPRVRRSVDGTPSSSSIPWMNSASVWLAAPTTRTSVALGVLRLDLARALRRLGRLGGDPARDERHPAPAQKRSSVGYVPPHVRAHERVVGHVTSTSTSRITPSR